MVPEATEYEALKSMGAWVYLKRTVEEYRERVLAKLTARLWNVQKVDPEEIAYTRGFYEGALWIVDHPEDVAQNLERAAEKAWQEILAGEVARGPDSPYT